MALSKLALALAVAPSAALVAPSAKVSSTKLAAGFGVCGNAPLGDQPAARPQIAPARPPQTASVGEAFGSAIDGWSNAPRPPTSPGGGFPGGL